MPRNHKHKKSPEDASSFNDLFISGLVILAGVALLTFVLQSLLSEEPLATILISRVCWVSLIDIFSAQIVQDGDLLSANISYASLFIPVAIFALLCWLVGAVIVAQWMEQSWSQSAAEWGWCWAWWLLPVLWEILRIVAVLMGLEAFAALHLQLLPIWLSISLAGWLASGVAQAMPVSFAVEDTTKQDKTKMRIPLSIWGGIGISICLFTAMNWQLYWALLLPHGDSAMYEEHLWNVLHGKGFRSYLDQGLFLGEHIQLIHLFLIPVYVLWPSHLTMELCEAIALASGAIPVYWLTLRATKSSAQAVALSLAYLLYTPLHFLDISVDVKTFRPIGFGIPLLLFALDQIERQRLWTAAVLLLITLTAKEDYAVICIPLGIRMAFCCKENKQRQFGIVLAIGSLIYLLLAVLVLIPYFRSGADVHYARYFGELGDSPADIVRSLFTQPLLVLQKLFSLRTLIYVFLLLIPIAGLPLRVPSRLCVALPLFGILSLMEFTQAGSQQYLIPYHHFHAPLIPILFWAGATGMAELASDLRHGENSSRRIHFLTHFTWTCGLATGLFFSYTPISITFWDAGSPAYWRARYVPGERSRQFERVIDLVPASARVASTDFIHPRFTHHERSYDYSNYPRAVNDGKPGAPPDTDFIVIDTQHSYSDIKRPEQIREFREHPDQWEILPDQTDGYFIILKRKAIAERESKSDP